jgi:hypothetical protein
MEKAPGAAPFLRNIHVFEVGVTASVGPSASSIDAMRFAVPRVVDAITREMPRADVAARHPRLRAHQEPERPPRP